MAALLASVKTAVNARLATYTPFDTVVLTVVSVVVASLAHAFLQRARKVGPVNALLGPLIRAMKHVPGVKGQIDKENDKTLAKMEHAILGKFEKHFGIRVPTLPQDGMPDAELFKILDGYKAVEEKQWKGGRASGCIYSGDDTHVARVNKAFCMFSLANPLHPDVFPLVRKMEAEVVSMTIDLLGGDAKAGCCGTMTSGGTESILLAMKSYREQAKARGIETPEVVTATTAHAAFNKAAHYFNIKLVQVEVDQTTFLADVPKMAKAINSNTIALVGSAPQFPHGVIDPIEELAALALRKGIFLHVDCCLGGWLLPFIKELGYKVPPFDFKVPGVTSISCDTHKYGYAPKGASTILYRTKELRRSQYCIVTDWVGGIYPSPTLAGSRPGGLVAGTWAALVSQGRTGYLKCAKAIMEATDQIRRGIEEMKDVKLMGTPSMSIICFTTSDSKIDVYQVSEAMTNRGWALNTLQYPRCIHICLTYMHRNAADAFLKDLQESVDDVRANPQNFKSGAAAIYGLAESLPDRSLVQELTSSFVDTLYKV